MVTVCLVVGTGGLFLETADYVERLSPGWFVPAGAGLALVNLVAARTRFLRTSGLVIATVLLLPGAVAASVMHVLRMIDAIPLPVDPVSAVISVVAAATLISLWAAPSPLRPARDLSTDVPRWVAAAGIVASLIYPALKASWALGSAWVAPPHTVGVLDTTFWATTGVALVGAVPLIVVLARWDRPTPQWSRPVALLAGMTLSSIGAAGLWSARLDPDQIATGLFVYGSWLAWGLAVIAVSRRLGPQKPRG